MKGKNFLTHKPNAVFREQLFGWNVEILDLFLQMAELNLHVWNFFGSDERNS